MKQLIILSICFGCCFAALGQDSLMALMENSTNAPTVFTSPAFKGTRVVNGQSVQTAGKKNLDFIISHRFGRLNEGGYEAFGLDNAVTRLGLEYGLTENLTLGVGRSTYLKTFDFYGKARLLRQTDDNRMPMTVALFYSLAMRTQRLLPPDKLRGSDKLSHAGQVLLARRFSPRFSLQLSPTVVHRNRPETPSDEQTVFATGIAGRFKLSKRISFNPEYFYVFPGQVHADYANCLSLGVDIETGGHVFQLHFTNSFGMTERYFITEATDSWGDGDVHFGFNIMRTFYLGKKQKQTKSW